MYRYIEPFHNDIERAQSIAVVFEMLLPGLAANEWPTGRTCPMLAAMGSLGIRWLSPSSCHDLVDLLEWLRRGWLNQDSYHPWDGMMQQVRPD